MSAKSVTSSLGDVVVAVPTTVPMMLMSLFWTNLGFILVVVVVVARDVLNVAVCAERERERGMERGADESVGRLNVSSTEEDGNWNRSVVHHVTLALFVSAADAATVTERKDCMGHHTPTWVFKNKSVVSRSREEVHTHPNEIRT